MDYIFAINKQGKDESYFCRDNITYKEEREVIDSSIVEETIRTIFNKLCLSFIPISFDNTAYPVVVFQYKNNKDIQIEVSYVISEDIHSIQIKLLSLEKIIIHLGIKKEKLVSILGNDVLNNFLSIMKM